MAMLLSADDTCPCERAALTRLSRLEVKYAAALAPLASGFCWHCTVTGVLRSTPTLLRATAPNALVMYATMPTVPFADTEPCGRWKSVYELDSCSLDTSGVSAVSTVYAKRYVNGRSCSAWARRGSHTEVPTQRTLTITALRDSWQTIFETG